MAGTRNSSVGPPWRIDAMTHRTTSESFYHGATSRYQSLYRLHSKFEVSPDAKWVGGTKRFISTGPEVKSIYNLIIDNKDINWRYLFGFIWHLKVLNQYLVQSLFKKVLYLPYPFGFFHQWWTPFLIFIFISHLNRIWLWIWDSTNKSSLLDSAATKSSPVCVRVCVCVCVCVCGSALLYPFLSQTHASKSNCVIPALLFLYLLLPLNAVLS